MKLIVASFALLLPLAAAAQPASGPAQITAPAEPAPRPQSTFVEAAASIGSSSLPETIVAASLALGVDHHLGGAVWLHAGLGYVNTSKVLTSVDGDVVQGQVGVLAKECSDSRGRCSFAGIDAGLRYAHVSGSTAFFGDPGMDVMYEKVEPMLIPRIGLDLGGERFRVRPAIEVPLAPSGAAMMLTVGIAVGTR